MKLKDFKEGDIIHRTKPFSRGNQENSDYSFTDTEIRFLGIKSGLLFYMYVEDEELNLGHKVRRMTIAHLDDNNWGYFPTETEEKFKLKYESVAK